MPEPGGFVFLRHRPWMVEQVSPAPTPGEAHLVELSGIDDDATGTKLTVLWEAEPDARPLGATVWDCSDRRFRYRVAA